MAGVVAGCAAAVVVGVGAPVAGAQVFGVGDVVRLAGSVPAWAAGGHGAAVPAGQVRHIAVALADRDEQGAQALALAVSTPGNPAYRHYLSPAQYRDRFGPSADAVTHVRNWLTSTGLRVGSVSANRKLVEASGTVAELDRAFGVQLGAFTLQGKRLVAPQSPVAVPREIRPLVQAVTGLDDSSALLRTQHRSTSAADQPAATPDQACAHYWGEHVDPALPTNIDRSNAMCGLTPAQIRSAYGLPGNATGAGQSIAIVDAYSSPTAVTDLQQWSARHGLPPAAVTLNPPDAPYTTPPSCEGPAQWNFEENLDLQTSHAMAPLATLDYFPTSSCATLLAGDNAAVAKGTDAVISNSFGQPDDTAVSPDERDAWNSDFVEAAVQGQAVLVSTGDNGDESTVVGHPAAQFPASSPWVTAVGGTTLSLDQAGHQRWQAGWAATGYSYAGGTWNKQGFALGGGGGRSGVFAEPDWQRGVVPDAIARGNRSIPDIAMDGDPYTGVVIGQTVNGAYQEVAAGGTSMSAPLLAGMIVDRQQVTGAAAGYQNVELYSLRTSPAIATVFSPSSPRAVIGTPRLPRASADGEYLLAVDSRPQTLYTAPGWDNLTGIGTPTGAFVTQP